MKKTFVTLVLAMACAVLSAQTFDVRERVMDNLQLARGCNYMLDFDVPAPQKAPRGYESFYISHYGRHGARYYWGENRYLDLRKVLSAAAEGNRLTERGRRLWEQFDAAYDDLYIHATELSSKGWEQHREIARRMYSSYPAIFKNNPRIFAASSPVGRCQMSMASFCLSLKEQDPKLDVMESASREFYPSIIPFDDRNPFPEKYEDYPFAWSEPQWSADLGTGSVDYQAIALRVFTDLDFLSGLRPLPLVVSDLWNLSINTPCSDVEMDFDGLFTPDEMYFFFARDCAGFYYDCGRNRYQYIPMLRDYLSRAEAAVEKGEPAVDLRFGHDGILMAFVILTDMDHFGHRLERADQIPVYCPLYRIPMGANLQMVFYHPKGGKSGEVLLQVLLNGEEVELPFPAFDGSFYRWSDFKTHYEALIAAHPRLDADTEN